MRAERPGASTRRQAVGIILAHDYEGQKWLRLHHGIRVRTTRQHDRGTFDGLPFIGEVAERYGWDHWTVDDLLANPWARDHDVEDVDLVDAFDVEPEQDGPSIYFNPLEPGEAESKVEEVDA